jgi:hypothetical protein
LVIHWPSFLEDAEPGLAARVLHEQVNRPSSVETGKWSDFVFGVRVKRLYMMQHREAKMVHPPTDYYQRGPKKGELKPAAVAKASKFRALMSPCTRQAMVHLEAVMAGIRMDIDKCLVNWYRGQRVLRKKDKEWTGVVVRTASAHIATAPTDRFPRCRLGKGARSMSRIHGMRPKPWFFPSVVMGTS